MHTHGALAKLKRNYKFSLDSFLGAEEDGDAHISAKRSRTEKIFAGHLVIGACRRLNAQKEDLAKATTRGQTHELLPVGIIEDGRLKQYAWSADGLYAMQPNHVQSGAVNFGKLSLRINHLQHAVMEAFFPHRSAVTEDYWEYIWWRAGHRLASAMLNNFATQALLAAVGVGAQSQLPAAATINWLLKDGLGRLGRLSVAARFGQSFDSDLKRFRWMTSLIFSGSISLEFLTPLLPKQFLLLACLSNVGKSVGVTTYVATHPAFMRSFAVGENLADINAKGQAQQMVMDTLGLAICVGLTFAVRHRPQFRLLLPICTFPFLVGMDLTCIFHELKATHLHTLNRERAELVAERWLVDGRVFNAKEVSKQERLLLNSQVGGGLLPLHFTLLNEVTHSPQQLESLLSRHNGQSYLMNYSNQLFRPPYPGASSGRGHLPACLEHGAASLDILEAILQAAIFRKIFNLADHALCQEPSTWSSNNDVKLLLLDINSPFKVREQTMEHLREGVQRVRQMIPEDCLDRYETSLQGVDGVRWSYGKIDAATGQKGLTEAAKLARMAAPAFVADLEASGWSIHPMKLSMKEKNGYVLFK